MQKKTLDRELISSRSMRPQTTHLRMRLILASMCARARQDDAAEAIKHGISVDDFVKLGQRD